MLEAAAEGLDRLFVLLPCCFARAMPILPAVHLLGMLLSMLTSARDRRSKTPCTISQPSCKMTEHTAGTEFAPCQVPMVNANVSMVSWSNRHRPTIPKRPKREQMSDRHRHCISIDVRCAPALGQRSVLLFRVELDHPPSKPDGTTRSFPFARSREPLVTRPRPPTSTQLRGTCKA